MKKTDKNSPQNRQSDDTLIYILLFLLFIVLVGGLVWYFWPEEKEWNFNYKKELGEKLTSPKADDVSKLISSNRSRIKTARRILEDKMQGRKLSAKEKDDVKAELDKVNGSLDEALKSVKIKELEEDSPDTLAFIYSQLYGQGEISVRLKAKTSVDRSYGQLMRQVKVQDEWINLVAEEETKDIMNKWIRKWYDQARERMIESGEEKLLKVGVLPVKEDGEKIENPTEAKIKSYQKVYDDVEGEDGIPKTVDLSKPLILEFNGYWGFLTEEDKKGSSEGKETFGLTKSGSVGEISGKQQAAHPKDYKFKYIVDNYRPISIGLEKKLFFNRLGYEEWISNVEKNGSRGFFDICFEEVVETIAHELAHAIIGTIRVSYDGEEGGGHGEYFYKILKKIERMIKESPDFLEFETWWKKPEKEQKEWAAGIVLVDEKSHWDEWKYWYIGGGVGVLAIGLGVIIVFWDGSISSKKNVKN